MRRVTIARLRMPKHRRWLLLIVTATVLLVGAIALAVGRYLPLLDHARDLRGELRAFAETARSVTPALDSATLVALRERAAAARSHYSPLADTVRDDPLVAVARHVPLIGESVRAADDLLGATGLLLDVVDDGLLVADGYSAVLAEPSGEGRIAGLVGLLAEATDELAASARRLDAASALLKRIPQGVPKPIAAARAEAQEQLDRYRPLLDQARQAATLLPPMFAWDEPRTYLVLQQDPAELRPTGGYIGSYGRIVVDRGRIVEKTFADILTLSNRPGLPYVAPPPPLKEHLLGEQSWRLADVNWWPDVPLVAQQAAEFYALESGGEQLDGVVVITTYAIDELLTVVGPIAVPEYGRTIRPGRATIGILAATRTPLEPRGDRKAFLGVFADRLLERLYSLPAARWPDLLPALERARAGRDAAIWMRDRQLQTIVARAGWAGEVGAPVRDELLLVEANVGPVSKLHLVTDRTIEVDVTLDADGTAHTLLSIAWHNRVRDEDAPATVRETASTLLASHARDLLGVYVRALTPARSTLAEVDLETPGPDIGGLETIGEELGRASFGAYALIPPGTTTLRYGWVVPDVVQRRGEVTSYSLRMVKPAGRPADRLRIAVHLPAGATFVTSHSAVAHAGPNGAGIVYDDIWTKDVEIGVTFRSPSRQP